VIHPCVNINKCSRSRTWSYGAIVSCIELKPMNSIIQRYLWHKCTDHVIVHLIISQTAV